MVNGKGAADGTREGNSGQSLEAKAGVGGHTSVKVRLLLVPVAL